MSTHATHADATEVVSIISARVAPIAHDNVGLCTVDCPGTTSGEAGKSEACAGCPNQAACASAPRGPDLDQSLIDERISKFRHIILVLSGKGGVGKSTFSAQLAFAMAAKGLDVGLLDIDICGPSTSTLVLSIWCPTA